MKKNIAELILRVALDCSRKADESAKIAMDSCDKQTFETYRQQVGQIMGNIFTEIMSPIYEEHPTLAPAWYEPGLRQLGDVIVTIDDPARTILTATIDDIYQQINKLLTDTLVHLEEPSRSLYRSRFHEVLLHVSTARVLLALSRNAGSKRYRL
jgi:hypothetical protein